MILKNKNQITDSLQAEMQLAMPHPCPGQPKALHTHRKKLHGHPAPQIGRPQTHSEMHSGPDALAGQSTRHSEVGKATACQAHPGVRYGALQCFPSASGPSGVRPLGPDTVDGPDTHGWPLQCVCGAAGKPELRQLNILYLGGLGMGKVG